ncbi:MAG: RnfABCDGE type electron transport complex subunit D [Clostridia bacterium]|nr:RnfABCDGE type electron transport complex subunit D [Clostridia bacterium]
MPEFLTVSSSPHIKSPETTTTVMLDVIIALLPAFIWGIYVFGLRALVIGVICVGACIGFEAAAQFVLHRPITIGDLSAAVTGLLLAMNLPVTVPLWMPVVGAFFAIVIVKQLFGGIGKNFVNPALAARVFLFSWAGEMTTFQLPGKTISSLAVTLQDADIVAGATPLASLKMGTLPDINLFDMLIGNIGGCIGEVSSLLLIAGGIYLIVFRRVITWHIPAAYIGTVALLTFLFPQHGGVAFDFMLCELLSGGLIIGAFFMATDYATSPVTPLGRIIYGVGCGIITVLIRFFGSYPEGVSFSILIMNMLVWYLDKATMPRRFGGKTHGK